MAQTQVQDESGVEAMTSAMPSVGLSKEQARENLVERVARLGSFARSIVQPYDWKGALESCKKVLEHDPEHIGALEVAAQALWFEGSFEDVVKTTTQLLMLNPDEPGYRYTRGMALMSLGRLSQASNDFRQAMSQSKDPRFIAQVQNALIVIEEFQSGWVGHKQRLEAIKFARQFSDKTFKLDVRIH